jgi:hypothetical protein
VVPIFQRPAPPVDSGGKFGDGGEYNLQQKEALLRLPYNLHELEQEWERGEVGQRACGDGGVGGHHRPCVALLPCRLFNMRSLSAGSTYIARPGMCYNGRMYGPRCGRAGRGTGASGVARGIG